MPANGAVLLASGSTDLAGPKAPVLTLAGEGNGSLDVAWATVSGAASYDVWVSPVTGGGYVKANTSPLTGTSTPSPASRNGVAAYIVVTANDGAGNASALSNEVHGLPHYAIGWSNLQWPPTLVHTISTVNRTDTAYGQVWIDGVTNQPGATPGLRAQLGYGPDGSNPDGNAAWTWVNGAFNTDAGNNDEFMASLLPEATGAFDYACRYSTTGGRDWVYADLDGSGGGYQPAQAGALTVNGAGDTTAPATPDGLRVVSASPAGIELAWDPVAGDPTLYGYELLRSPPPAARTRSWPGSRRRPTRTGRQRGRDVALRRPRAGPVVQPVGSVGVGRGDGRAPDGDAHVQRDGTGNDRRDGPRREHRGLPRPPRWRASAVEPGRDAAHPGGRDPLDDHVHRQGGDPARVQVALGDWDHVEKDTPAARSRTASSPSPGARTARRP